MIAVIKGDIINSRKISDPEQWLLPLKQHFEKWGSTPQQWEFFWGDFFQIEISDPADALSVAFEIKALVKSLSPKDYNKKTSPIDVRMAIGIGEKSYSSPRISESNGEAFIFSGERFDTLKKEKVTLAVRSPWSEIDDEVNLNLRLAQLFMDKWSLSSAEIIQAIWQMPGATQSDIGTRLGIKQNSVSGRWSRANADELLAVAQRFKLLINSKLLC